MAKISRYSFNCPHCKKELRSGWGEGSYASMPEQMNCPHCGGIITLSESQLERKQIDRTESLAFQRGCRGGLFVFIGGALLGSYLGYVWAKNNYSTFDTQVWLAVVGIGLAIGFVIFGIVGVIRVLIAGSQIKKEGQQKRS
jgi:DNA-directed RNA polymerase subunit RPC12/RpoP